LVHAEEVFQGITGKRVSMKKLESAASFAGVAVKEMPTTLEHCLSVNQLANGGN